MKRVTVCYTTARKEPHFEWFAWSLARELRNTPGIEVDLLVVDFYAEPQRDDEGWDEHDVEKRFSMLLSTLLAIPEIHKPALRSFKHVPPKPNVWQGPYRETKENWFAVSNTRNTAICHCKTDWIAFVDDLSTLVSGWLAEVATAMDSNWIVCGAYEKVERLKVNADGGRSYEEFIHGKDNRWPSGSDTATTPCHGGNMYGCSLVAPIGAFLSVNGYDERCCGLGFEDVITGHIIERRRWRFGYSRRMKTLEDNSAHFVGPGMKKSDYGVSPADKSHKILDIARSSEGWCPNDFTPHADLKAMREHILNGGLFPEPQYGQKEWFTGTPLTEL